MASLALRSSCLHLCFLPHQPLAHTLSLATPRLGLGLGLIKSCCQSLRGVVIVCSADDFEALERGPSEPILPKFNRLPYKSSLPYNPISISTSPTHSSTPYKRRRGRRLIKKLSPPQAIAGSLIAGFCALGVMKAAWAAYEQIQLHPLAHDLPFHLTEEVNQFALAAVTGFGGLAVCMFGVSSVGLALLSVQLIYDAKFFPHKPNK